MRRGAFFTEKKRGFVARSIMDIFKVLFPASLVTGLFIKPIPWPVKLGAVVSLAALFGFSVYLYPEGD